MKKRIIALALIFLMIFTNYVFADEGVNYEREDGRNLDSIAKIITENTYLPYQYSGYTVGVPYSNIEVYKYNNLNEKLTCNTSPIPEYYQENKNQYFLTCDTNGPGSNESLLYEIQLAEGRQSFDGIATFLYKDAYIYNGQKYNIRMDIKRITKTGSHEQQIYVLLGQRNYMEGRPIDTSTYNLNVKPLISVGDTGEVNKVRITVNYYIVDKDLNPVNVSGVFGITDIDSSQGMYLSDFEATKKIHI